MNFSVLFIRKALGEAHGVTILRRVSGCEGIG